MFKQKKVENSAVFHLSMIYNLYFSWIYLSLISQYTTQQVTHITKTLLL